MTKKCHKENARQGIKLRNSLKTILDEVCDPNEEVMITTKKITEAE